VEGQFFEDTELSFDKIKEQILPRIQEHLQAALVANVAAGKQRVQKFVDEKAPRYRPILSRISDNDLAVDQSISDKDLDMYLHRQLYELERSVLDNGHTILNPRGNESIPDYQDRVRAYLNDVSDIKKSDLADYLCHRRVIIELLEQALKRKDDGKYVREDIIHELIMPMRKDSNEVHPDSCNLWLLDEKLAFHNYLASDKTLGSMPITGATGNKEPDILALNVYDNPILVSDRQTPPLASIVVYELKRPMRNDTKAGEEKDDPIMQCLGYLQRTRKGQVQTPDGRLIPNSQDIPGYCYVICDLTPTVIERCESFDLTVTSDHMGYFGFHKTYKAFIEVISFDRLVSNAKQRNQAFFDKLGLPTT
jgi:hypothetical protein